MKHKAISRGANASYLETEVVECLQFNMVRGFYTTGKNMRIKVQVKPGMIHGYDHVIAKLAEMSRSACGGRASRQGRDLRSAALEERRLRRLEAKKTLFFASSHAFGVTLLKARRAAPRVQRSNTRLLMH